jgi:hypothetical protein
MKIKQKKLKQLCALTQLVLERDLSALHAIAAQKKQASDALCTLDQGLNTLQNWEDNASVKQSVLFEQWADSRRREINVDLAQKTALWLEARDVTRKSYGQNLALRKIQQLCR